MPTENNFFAPPAGAIDGSAVASPGAPDFRWAGQPTGGEKTPQSAERARRNAFSTVEEFQAWRKSKGMPDLSRENLVWAWANYKGEPTTEQAVLNPILERR